MLSAPPCPLCPCPLTIRRTWAVINKALNRAPSSLKAACCQPPSYISLSVYVFLYSFSCVAGTLGIQSHERGQEANKSSCPLVSLFLSSLKNKMKTIWLRALHFPPPCTSIDEEFHLQWGFTLIREGAVIQASIHFSGTLQSLKVLTHWVKLSREDKKGSSSQEVTAARFSTPCTLLEKCHKLSMERKITWLPSSLNDMPYKMKDLRV